MYLIKIKSTRDVNLLNPEHIIRIEALSNYSKVYLTNDRPMVVPKVLHWFEDKLPTQLFVRVHRSHLINKFFAKKITGTQNNILLLSNGECISMSRRLRKALVL
ncbi:MAG: LytTR family transcriptional regulator [Ferruginibacter sp.]|nr:LytTR family transcriptional regulator [Ferruginibacter sp.]